NAELDGEGHWVGRLEQRGYFEGTTWHANPNLIGDISLPNVEGAGPAPDDIENLNKRDEELFASLGDSPEQYKKNIDAMIGDIDPNKPDLDNPAHAKEYK